MAYARHETFHFREGWLTKGIKAVAENPGVFMGKDAMEQLGIGNNMVKALRYWMMATHLTDESSGGKKTQRFTQFGEVVIEYDKYFEEEITLWLLHYYLATNKELATTWYWFFNVFNHKEFDEELFLNELDYWVKQQGEEVSSSSLKKDFDCLISTYCPTRNTNLNPEDNLVCPLQDLGLIELVDPKKKRYRFSRKNISAQPLELFIFALLEYMGKNGYEKDINFDSLFSDENALGRVFVLGLSDLILILERLEVKGYVRVNKTAGLNHVSVKQDIDPFQIIKAYYMKLRTDEVVGAAI